MNDIISNPEIWLGIVALNMTVIGLTSLAEKRLVIGVEYGKYLIDKFRLYNVVRLYHLMVVFAIVNALSLVFMWWNVFPILRKIIFLLLIVSTWGLIVYFLEYILRVNRKVKGEIYKNEILGMYIKSDKPCNFEGDRIVGIMTGDRTAKKISSNVQSYFNEYNDETIHDFDDLFGPASIIYQRNDDVLNFWKQLVKNEPHDYTVYDDKGQSTGIYHISWEFFQMYRFSELQDKWLLEILNLFNKEYANPYPLLRLFNVARVLGQINKVGFAERLYHYKFLDYLTPYIIEALETSTDVSERRQPAEDYMLRQLAYYIFTSLSHKREHNFYDSARKTLNQLLTIQEFRGTVGISQRMKIFENACAEGNRLGEQLLKELRTYVCEQQADIENIVFDFGNVLVDWNPHYLYDDYFKDATKCNEFIKTVLTTAWLKRIDEGYSLDQCIEEAVAEHPEYTDAIRIYKPRWQETIKGPVKGMEQVVEEVKKRYPVYGLSNWNMETFRIAYERYAILQAIEQRVVSGDVKMAKPDNRIFKYFLKKFELQAEKCLFIDDNLQNVMAARHNGMKAICFKDASQLRALLLEN